MKTAMQIEIDTINDMIQAIRAMVEMYPTSTLNASRYERIDILKLIKSNLEKARDTTERDQLIKELIVWLMGVSIGKGNVGIKKHLKMTDTFF